MLCLLGIDHLRDAFFKSIFPLNIKSRNCKLLTKQNNCDIRDWGRWRCKPAFKDKKTGALTCVVNFFLQIMIVTKIYQVNLNFYYFSSVRVVNQCLNKLHAMEQEMCIYQVFKTKQIEPKTIFCRFS
jgi:hypothetical protein